MVLQNHVILQNNIPARFHFRDHQIIRRVITDSQSGLDSTRQVLEFQVDRLDGQATAAVFSTMAEKLAGQFGPYLPTKSYVNYEIIITQTGDGFRRNWSVQFIPLGK